MSSRDKFLKGERLRCAGARDERNLTIGNVYEVLRDEEEGIFSDRPFVSRI